MNSSKLLQKYFCKDTAGIITEYIEDSWNFYKVNRFLSWSSTKTLNTFYNPIICSGIRLKDSLYYAAIGGVQQVTGNLITNLSTPFSPRALAVCCEKFFLVTTYGHLLVVHNIEWKILHEYDIGNLSMTTLCSYGSCVYLAGKECNVTYKTSGNILKLSCNEDGELSGVKVIKVASCATLLCANINYLCVSVGNKVVIYHADTLWKVATINIGMFMYDAIIKGDNLILRTGDGYSQIRINLSDFSKKVVDARIEILELPHNLIVN
jgi:hypothetical protein